MWSPSSTVVVREAKEVEEDRKGRKDDEAVTMEAGAMR